MVIYSSPVLLDAANQLFLHAYLVDLNVFFWLCILVSFFDLCYHVTHTEISKSPNSFFYFFYWIHLCLYLIIYLHMQLCMYAASWQSHKNINNVFCVEICFTSCHVKHVLCEQNFFDVLKWFVLHILSKSMPKSSSCFFFLFKKKDNFID